MAGVNPAMIIRVAANIEELKRNLAEGRSQIEATTAGMQKMAASLDGSKLEQRAHNIVASINSIGGATKLTDAEAARHLRTLDAWIEKGQRMGREIPADILKTRDALDRVAAPAPGISTSMISIGTAIGTMAANALMALGNLAVKGIGAVVNLIGELVSSGAKLSGTEGAFQRLAVQVGATGAAMLGAMRTGTRGLVVDLDLMQAANKAVLLGLPVTSREMGDLARTATVLGRAMGSDATTSLNDLITALGRSSPLILDNLGLTVKVGEANETYAAKLGTTAAQLTDAEKKTAFYEAAMIAARAKVLALGEAQLTLGDNIQKAGVWWNNFKDDLAIAIARSPVLGAGLDALGKSLAAAFGGSQERLVAAISKGINKVAIWAVDAALAVTEFGMMGAKSFGVMRVPLDALTTAAVYLVERFAAGIATMAELAAKMPGVGRLFDSVAAQARNVASGWAEARTRAQEQLQSTMDLATGHGVIHGTLGKVKDGLIAMRTAMAEATSSTHAERAALAEATAAKVAYNTETVKQEGALVRAAAAGAKFEAEMRKFEETQKVLPPFTGLLGNMERKVVELDTATKAWRSNLVFTAETIETNVTAAIDKMVQKAEAAKVALGALSDPMNGAKFNVKTVNPVTGEGMEGTDPRVKLYLMQGYTLGEAIALASGIPTNIGAPHGRWTRTGWVPGRADGGPVEAHQPYMVGERGPELFVPEKSGAIVPNGAAAGGMHLTVNVTQPLGTPRAIARAVREAMVDYAKGQGQRLPSHA